MSVSFNSGLECTSTISMFLSRVSNNWLIGLWIKRWPHSHAHTHLTHFFTVSAFVLGTPSGHVYLIQQSTALGVNGRSPFFLPDITARTALIAVRPDVFMPIIMSQQTLHTAVTIATLYQHSNTSRILKLVCYYAVIISLCGKLWMQTWWKTVLAALQKCQSSSKIWMDRLIKGRRKNVGE